MPCGWLAEGRQQDFQKGFIPDQALAFVLILCLVDSLVLLNK